MNREIPIIADDYVDIEYGTGAVKITPAHDPNDFEMGLRHNLPQITVIGKDAKMNAEAGVYEGMDRYECRDAVVKAMDELGLLVKIEDISHAVGECYRCGNVIEPLISPQWFVKMKPLAEPAIEAVKTGDIRFVPQRFEKIYLRWLEEIRDWCISRQLWWGHRIPVWYCDDCGEVICQKTEPEVCPKCGSKHLRRDEDVLDTWFSSGLWPFETLGWPDEEKLAKMRKFYPTSVLVTGRDIIFFWVARMIFTGLHFMEEKPFSDVFIHGLVLDAQGRKMSKSLGNGIDPIEIIEQYGADPLRFMLITGNTPGNDLRFQMERLEASRNFVNKIWNASRFVLMNLDDYQPGSSEPVYSLADKWILSELKRAAASISANLGKYELGEAARQVYDFTWDCFCDWYIEMSKPRLYGDNAQERYTAQTVLVEVLTNILKLLHPFMPFITEEIWQALPHEGKTIMLAKWPEAEAMQDYPEEAAVMSLNMEAVRAVRNIRAEMNVQPGKKVELIFATDTAAEGLQQGEIYIKALCGAESMTVLPGDTPAPEQAAVAHIRGVDIYLPLKGLIDLDKEIARLNKEIANMDKEIKRLEGKLNNQGFISKAPAEVVEGERVKLADYSEKKASLLERVGELNKLA
jgi:valyl-tRNA synthetase